MSKIRIISQSLPNLRRQTALLVALTAMSFGAVGCKRTLETSPRASSDDAAAPRAEEARKKPMHNDGEVFEITMNKKAPASLAKRQAFIEGRLRVWVNKGSQYATWSQFPGTIQYEIRLPSGKTERTINLEMDVTEAEGFDGEDPYAEYAAEPSDQFVEKTFDVNLFHYLSGHLTAAGRYGVRALYQGSVSNWVEFELMP